MFKAPNNIHIKQWMPLPGDINNGTSVDSKVFRPNPNLELWFCPKIIGSQPSQACGEVGVTEEATMTLMGLFFKVEEVLFDHVEYPRFVNISLREVVSVFVAEGSEQDAQYWGSVSESMKDGANGYLSFPISSGDLRVLEAASNDIQ